MTDLVRVCKLNEIEDGKINSFDVEGVPIFIVRIGNKLIARSRICTHQTFDLSQGIYSDGFLTCPLHASTFEVETGEALNPPAKEPLDEYPVLIKGDEVFIEI
ncbi:MAG: hypothetical protein D6732_20150 [Methanobacteriota archaeon]|nr:MAG: hypothetical protein D6732_20150 [Euryarchaeota archaeon]